LEEISSGTLRIGDRVVNDVPPKDRDIAMVFQSYALYPHMSVRDNLAFGLKLRKVPKAEIERRVNEAAETIQLQKLLDRKPKELSGGQRPRVALGRAIVRGPYAAARPRGGGSPATARAGRGKTHSRAAPQGFQSGAGPRSPASTSA